jgi:hypothetical protein
LFRRGSKAGEKEKNLKRKKEEKMDAERRVKNKKDRKYKRLINFFFVLRDIWRTCLILVEFFTQLIWRK